MSLTRLWHRQAKSREAGSLLSTTYAWFTEGFETEDLRHARDLLVETGVTVPPRPPETRPDRQ
jgi:hypothetical protein